MLTLVHKYACIYAHIYTNGNPAKRVKRESGSPCPMRETKVAAVLAVELAQDDGKHSCQKQK